MGKQITWEIKADDTLHRVTCTSAGNRYEIWADDEDLTVVYRQSVRRMYFGIEQEIELFGKKCLFVVWDERPDIVVDGRMLGKNTDYLQAREKRKLTSCKGFRITFWIGVLLIFAALVLTIVFPQIKLVGKWVRIALGGLLLVVAGVIYERKWSRW